MNPFAVAIPKSYEQARALLGDKSYKLSVLKAGGLDVLDHLKEGLASPDLLVNIKRVRSEGEPIREEAGGIRIDATTTLAEIAGSKLVHEKLPALAQAAGSAATPHVRHVGTLAGNLLQRPRCWYYRNDQYHCLKKGGATCYAVAGENAFHAIFGGGPCHIVHPSNLAPALVMADAVVHTIGGPVPQRHIRELFHLPSTGVSSEHTLQAGEVVTHVVVRPSPRSGFYVAKHKQSFDWPMAFAVAGLEMEGSTIRSARVVAGAVAPIPWMLPQVERALAGVAVVDDDALRRACALAGDGAVPMAQNAYKVALLPVVVRRAILRAAGLDPEPKA